jgi:hypothetical protein
MEGVMEFSEAFLYSFAKNQEEKEDRFVFDNMDTWYFYHIYRHASEANSRQQLAQQLRNSGFPRTARIHDLLCKRYNDLDEMTGILADDERHEYS